MYVHLFECVLNSILFLILSFVLTAARVTIDLEQRVIDVIENQKQVEVCLVKNGTSSRPIMALVSAEEIMGGAGSPGKHLQCVQLTE